LSAAFDTVALCRVLGVSRSAYYAYNAGESYVLKEEKAMISQEINRADASKLSNAFSSK